jgi:hypothetical protein
MKQTFFMGKSTISMAIFNSYVSHYLMWQCTWQLLGFYGRPTEVSFTAASSEPVILWGVVLVPPVVGMGEMVAMNTYGI